MRIATEIFGNKVKKPEDIINDIDFEYYALVNLALYLECLENDCIINKNIPNDLKYREKFKIKKSLKNLNNWKQIIKEKFL